MKPRLKQERNFELNPIRVAIIGSGNIGADLCERLLRDSRFQVIAIIGRRIESEGLLRFKNRVSTILHFGAESLKSIIDSVDGVFDATSAINHAQHWEICSSNNKWIIDLTPSKIGIPMVPSLMGVNTNFRIQSDYSANYSMVTCGGQSSALLLYAMSKFSDGISEVEISSSIASLSAGPATRRNIDQYISSTEDLARKISGAKSSKAILVINPLSPPVMMRTTVQMSVRSANIIAIQRLLQDSIHQIQKYVPGYELVVAPKLNERSVLTSTVKVSGSGYYLPAYAGNLDIINAAAVETAFLHFSSHSGEMP